MQNVAQHVNASEMLRNICGCSNLLLGWPWFKVPKKLVWIIDPAKTVKSARSLFSLVRPSRCPVLPLIFDRRNDTLPMFDFCWRKESVLHVLQWTGPCSWYWLGSVCAYLEYMEWDKETSPFKVEIGLVSTSNVNSLLSMFLFFLETHKEMHPVNVEFGLNLKQHFKLDIVMVDVQLTSEKSRWINNT